MVAAPEVLKVKDSADVALPVGVVTTILPALPPAISTLMVLLSITEKLVTAAPPKLTAEAPLKLVPEIVTVE